MANLRTRFGISTLVCSNAKKGVTHYIKMGSLYALLSNTPI